MTGRLIKYELRSSIKLMGVIWAALIVASFLFSISIKDIILNSTSQTGTISLITNLHINRTIKTNITRIIVPSFCII